MFAVWISGKSFKCNLICISMKNPAKTLSVSHKYKESNSFSFLYANRQNNYNMFSLCLPGKQSTCFPGKHMLYMFADPFIPRKQVSSPAVVSCFVTALKESRGKTYISADRSFSRGHVEG